MWALLRTFSWQELLHHPWRTASAVGAVMLGVALSFSVQLINASALAEFSSAVSAVNGQPDLELRSRQGLLDDALLERVAAQPGVALASPVLELGTAVLLPDGSRLPVRLLGVDALVVAQVSPALMPLPDRSAARPPQRGAAAGRDATSGKGATAERGATADQGPGAAPDPERRFDFFSPDAVYLNAAAREALMRAGAPLHSLPVQSGLALRTLRVAGTVGAPGAPLLLMDVAAAQALMDRVGRLSRIDLRLAPGTQPDALLAALALPPQLVAQRPGQSGERASNLSRAYRVNLTVLALVALFTGAFLVFSMLSLSVARRQQQFALLGVLGLAAPQRLRLVLTESALLGLLGSALGIALGTALAALALRVLGGDLGGGYFPGAAPPLQWHPGAALLYGGLGVVAALAGGWWPARAAARLAPALALKGLGSAGPGTTGWRQHGWALALMVLAAALAWAPPVAGIPLAAYVAIALLLVGGIAALPLAVGALLQTLAPWAARRALPMLALERSRRLRETAAVATSGVVASLALSVALTVMVASFRDSVTQWLDGVLPAELYVRAGGAGGGDGNTLPPAFEAAVAALPGVARVDPLRSTALTLNPSLPPVALLARPLGGAGAGVAQATATGIAGPDALAAAAQPTADPAAPGGRPRRLADLLPLVGTPRPLPAPDGGGPVVAVYVSEAMRDLHGATPGRWLPALALAFPPLAEPAPRFFVAGVWRDYARQHGSVVMDLADFTRLAGDSRVNDLALHLAPGASEDSVREAVRALARGLGGKGEPSGQGADGLIELTSAGQIRAISLRIFDRSFAVTYWLQAVAIGIGLFGVAASFSAQVLARRREFGLLAHLGLTRRQILGLVALEGLAWTTLGALAGLALGLWVSVVLVHVVNPQSFHWTMDLALPWLRLLGLCLAVVLAGTLTAWLAGRAAASRDAVRAVKEDW